MELGIGLLEGVEDVVGEQHRLPQARADLIAQLVDAANQAVGGPASFHRGPPVGENHAEAVVRHQRQQLLALAAQRTAGELETVGGSIVGFLFNLQFRPRLFDQAAIPAREPGQLDQFLTVAAQQRADVAAAVVDPRLAFPADGVIEQVAARRNDLVRQQVFQ